MKKDENIVEGGFVPKVKQKLTFAQLKLVENVPCYIKITKAIYEGKELKTTGEAKQKPANLMHVTDLSTGEEDMIIVVPSVLQSTLEESYEKETYVGKGFAVVMGEIKEGSGSRKYRTFKIDEIEV